MQRELIKINAAFNFSVVIQAFAVNVHEEYVLRGNSAVLKCSIPSFVSDFVVASAWIIDDDLEIVPNVNDYGT